MLGNYLIRIMKAIVLAGGFAKRLWPLTKNYPKPLLPVGGKPIIDFVIEKLVGLKALDKIIVTINRRFEDKFREWYINRSYLNLEFVVEPSMREEEKPGAVAAIANVIPLIGDDDAIIIAADNIFTSDLNNFINFYNNVSSTVIGLFDIGNRELAKLYATVVIDSDGRVINIIEKPEDPISTLISMCLYVMPNSHLRLIYKYLDLGGKRDAPGYFIEWLYRQVPIYGYVFKGLWYDIGDVDSYKKADEDFK